LLPHVLSGKQCAETVSDQHKVHLFRRKNRDGFNTACLNTTTDLLKLFLFVGFDWEHHWQWLSAHVIEDVEHERRLIGQHADTRRYPVNIIVSYRLSTATILLRSVSVVLVFCLTGVHFYVTVWPSNVYVNRDTLQSAYTPVSSKMCGGEGISPRYVTSHRGELSLLSSVEWDMNIGIGCAPWTGL